MIITIVYLVILAIFSLYSYALMDPNITFFNHPLWTAFRESVIYFGYYQRELSSWVYIGFIITLFAFHYLFVRKLDVANPFKIALFIGGIALFAYPFLSHDFFNYMFDAKILTYYHQNPYLHKALDFPADPWLRFMHWVHRTYSYGPVFLGITLIPSFFSFGKFILAFLFFKIMFVSFYLLTVFLLQRMDKRWAIFFATNPLVIVDGLVSSHIDLIATALGIVGVYYLFQKKQILSRVFFLLSGGIKFVTLPIIGLMESNKKINMVVFVAIIGMLYYIYTQIGVHPWYFLTFFIFLPFFPDIVMKANIFFAGLLFSYYPLIRFGDWKGETVDMKHQIMLVGFVLNLLYFVFIFSKRRFFSK